MPVVISQVATAVLAENVKAGTFGANVGGGEYFFPGNLTIGSNNNQNDIRLTFDYRDGYPYIIANHDYLGFMTAPEYYFDNNLKLKGRLAFADNSGNEIFSLKADVTNLFMGLKAGNDTTNSVNNIFIGEQSGNRVSTGSFNIGLGREALHMNTTGRYNVGLGYDALYSNETSNANTAIGFESLLVERGANNTAVGYRSGYENATGSGNVFLGNSAGYYETGSNKLYIDNDGNDALIYGDFAAGKVGINTTNPDANLRVNGTLKANYYIAYDGQYGLTKTVMVKGSNNQNCNLNFTNGLLTSTNCPTNGNNNSASQD